VPQRVSCFTKTSCGFKSAGCFFLKLGDHYDGPRHSDSDPTTLVYRDSSRAAFINDGWAFTVVLHQVLAFLTRLFASISERRICARQLICTRTRMESQPQMIQQNMLLQLENIYEASSALCLFSASRNVQVRPVLTWFQVKTSRTRTFSNLTRK
jgi:hypothetical protein